jgi:prepilin-type N-terminal cleavage/methylation domain-containing protein
LLHLYPNAHKPVFASEKGFTLVEVMTAISIYAILLGSVFSLYLFGVNAYKAASNRLDLQQNVRVAADFITRELRHAKALQQVNGHEIKYSNFGDTATYTIKYKNGEIVQLVNSTEVKIACNVDALIFDWDEDYKVLYFNIVGIDEGNTYAMRSAVYLQNKREWW